MNMALVASHTYTFGLYIELLTKSPSNGGVALFGKTTQNGFIDFQLVSTELYRSKDCCKASSYSLRLKRLRHLKYAPKII